MSYISPLIDWVTKRFLPSLVAVASIGILSFLYRKKIKSTIVNIFYYLTNKTMIGDVKAVYTYSIPDQDPIDIDFSHETWDRIESNTADSITEPDWGDNWATFNVEGVPPEVRIRLEPQLERGLPSPVSGAEAANREISGYKLVVETNGDLYFGYREMFPILKFKDFAERTKEVIEAEYLPGETPSTTRIQVTLTEGVPEGIEEIDDQKLNIKGQVRDNTLDLTFRKPEYLQRGLRKYFQVTN